MSKITTRGPSSQRLVQQSAPRDTQFTNELCLAFRRAVQPFIPPESPLQQLLDAFERRIPFGEVPLRQLSMMGVPACKVLYLIWTWWVYETLAQSEISKF